jgi:hypothetical protein
MSITFTPTGLKITSAEENIAEMEAVFKSVFGDEINLAPETPQGQLIASLAAIITDKDAQFLEFVNNINPDTADGYMQDALAALYLISRKPATYSSVILECRGRTGITIPANAEVKSEAGDIFVTTATKNHTHIKSQITDFAHTHTKSQITDFPAIPAMPDVSGFAPKPQVAAGLGLWASTSNQFGGTDLNVPSGGTWAYIAVKSATRIVAGIAAGGTSIESHSLFYWRIA